MGSDGIAIAAVDLGSNSFRLEIALSAAGRMRPLTSLKETVRLGSGLDEHGVLSEAAMQRGWDCLARFKEQLAGHERLQLRAVATQTLRAARNRDRFLRQARDQLGFPIEVIAGHEEARLIYRGVSHGLAPSDERRLVVDIGGGSTELILGSGPEIRYMDSFPVGSVSWSLRFFPTGNFRVEGFQAAEAAARSAMAAALRHCAPGSWDVAYGCAGTAGALGSILQAAGHRGDVIEAADLDMLTDQLLRAGNAERLRMAGLQEQLRPVIGGGISAMRAVLGLLEIQTLRIADGGLCLGVLEDLQQRSGQGHAA